MSYLKETVSVHLVFDLNELRAISPPAHWYPSEVEHSIEEAPFTWSDQIGERERKKKRLRGSIKTLELNFFLQNRTWYIFTSSMIIRQMREWHCGLFHLARRLKADKSIFEGPIFVPSKALPKLRGSRENSLIALSRNLLQFHRVTELLNGDIFTEVWNCGTNTSHPLYLKSQKWAPWCNSSVSFVT